MATIPIKKLLIANRGEIACRIIRTTKRMNIKTLAIYSSADKNAMHVRLADEAYYVGEAEPQKSYLNQDRIIELALSHGATAIHPGYGFLSENSEFSQRCQDEKLIFVGPSAWSIKTMGIKNESKRIMIEAGVPVVPGYHGLNQDNNLLLEEALKIGYPVLIKPVRGGGGKGMRVVYKESDFFDALESSRRESLKSFNDQSMLLEKYIERPRHVEVQVFGDLHGNHVHLFERDCSIQRRHQKIIEEAPAPLLSEDTRHELGDKAVAAAKAVDYVGAGTVEFILDKDDNSFYFMEMNTRLQVEHPITEMITQTDLVEWQLRIASGEQLPKKQDQIKISGHAFEARIYAEDPNDNFLPQTGQLNYMHLPAGSLLSESASKRVAASPSKTNNYRETIRLDTGVSVGDIISPHYDPMIAKLVVWDDDRKRALDRLSSALRQYIVVGVPTNIKFLTNLAENQSFAQADVGTDFIDLHHDELFLASNETDALFGEEQASKTLLAEIIASIYKLLSSSTDRKLRKELLSFRILARKKPIYVFNLRLIDEPKDKSIRVEYESVNRNLAHLSFSRPELSSSGTCSLKVSNVILNHDFEHEDDQVTVKLNDGRDFYKFAVESPILTDPIGSKETLVVTRNSEGENRLIKVDFEGIFNRENSANSKASNEDPLLARAPMPGIIEKILVNKGDSVKRGQNLVIMSAMKMEYTVKSNSEGQVSEINYKPGEFVAKESILVRLTATTDCDSNN